MLCKLNKGWPSYLAISLTTFLLENLISASRSDGQIEDRRNYLSNPSTSISQQTFQKSLSPQLQPRTSGQNSGTDQSSSFESSVSASAKWPRSASRKEVRFREEMVKSRERQRRNHQEAVCEFITDTSAFRAAMNYDDGVDDDNNRGNSRGHREYYQVDIGVDELVYGRTRPQTSQSVAQIGKNAGDCIKTQSPSKQQGESTVAHVYSMPQETERLGMWGSPL